MARMHRTAKGRFCGCSGGSKAHHRAPNPRQRARTRRRR